MNRLKSNSAIHNRINLENNIYIPVKSPLKDIIHLFWQVQRTNSQIANETILPKGIVEIIFSFSDEQTVFESAVIDKYLMPKYFINGYNTIPFHLHLPESQSLFGVQLLPSATKKLFGANTGELLNKCIDLTLIDKRIETMWYQLAEKRTFNERVNLFSTFALKENKDTDKRVQLLDIFLHNTANNQRLSATKLSQIINYSTRNLSRKIKELSGMNTEEFIWYKKYLQSLHCIQNTDLSLTEIAYESGFADQAHLTKSFKHFTCLLPSEYRKQKSQMIGHIYR